MKRFLLLMLAVLFISSLVIDNIAADELVYVKGRVYKMVEYRPGGWKKVGIANAQIDIEDRHGTVTTTYTNSSGYYGPTCIGGYSACRPWDVTATCTYGSQTKTLSGGFTGEPPTATVNFQFYEPAQQE